MFPIIHIIIFVVSLLTWLVKITGLLVQFHVLLYGVRMSSLCVCEYSPGTPAFRSINLQIEEDKTVTSPFSSSPTVTLTFPAVLLAKQVYVWFKCWGVTSWMMPLCMIRYSSSISDLSLQGEKPWSRLFRINKSLSAKTFLCTLGRNENNRKQQWLTVSRSSPVKSSAPYCHHSSQTTARWLWGSSHKGKTPHRSDCEVDLGKNKLAISSNMSETLNQSTVFTLTHFYFFCHVGERIHHPGRMTGCYVSWFIVGKKDIHLFCD